MSNNPLSIKDRPIIAEIHRDVRNVSDDRYFAWIDFGVIKKVPLLMNVPDWRIVQFYLWDDQDWLAPYFFEYFEKIPRIGYKYGRKIRREACVNIKSRYRKWRRTEWSKRVLKEYRKWKSERDSGNVSYCYPDWFAEHYRFSDKRGF